MAAARSLHRFRPFFRLLIKTGFLNGNGAGTGIAAVCLWAGRIRLVPAYHRVERGRQLEHAAFYAASCLAVLLHPTTTAARFWLAAGLLRP